MRKKLMNNYSRVTVREKNETKQVKISSASKPSIQEKITKKWQSFKYNHKNGELSIQVTCKDAEL